MKPPVFVDKSIIHGFVEKERGKLQFVVPSGALHTAPVGQGTGDCTNNIWWDSIVCSSLGHSPVLCT